MVLVGYSVDDVRKSSVPRPQLQRLLSEITAKDRMLESFRERSSLEMRNEHTISQGWILGTCSFLLDRWVESCIPFDMYSIILKHGDIVLLLSQHGETSRR